MMLTTLGRVIIGHDMGLGKTEIAMAAIAEALRERTDAAPGTRPYAILVGPPVARLGYVGDLAACFPNLTMVHLHGRKVHALPDADIYFIADDPLTLRVVAVPGRGRERSPDPVTLPAWRCDRGPGRDSP